MKTINSIIRLRRDNDYNFESIKNNFIPAKGEIVFVDTATSGLRIKVGDGITTYANLAYIDKNMYNTGIIQGYLYNNKFYSSASHENELAIEENKIYLDLEEGKIYYYFNNHFILVNNNNFHNASDVEPGIMKIYDTKGNNVDGTITQRLFTSEIEKKYSVSIDEQDKELLIFFNE